MSAEPTTHTFDATGNLPGPEPDDDALRPIQPHELVARTPLAELEAAIDGEVHLPDVRFPVPARKGVVIIYDTNIDNEILTAWQNRSIREDTRKGIDPLKLSCLVLVNKAKGFEINGRMVTAQGEALTFGHSEVWQMLKPPALSSIDACQRLFGVDAHVISTAEEVLRAAGYADTIRQAEEDPTVAPSSF